MNKGQGWHNEPSRHGLASRGIRTRMGARGHYHISENKCRDCGRLNCEGGASCEIATELRNGCRTSREPDVVKSTNLYDNKELKEEINKVINNFMDEPEDLGDPENPDSYSLFVPTIAAGHQGTHQPGIIADFLDLKIPADAKTSGGRPTTDWDEWEWAWEEIEDKADEIADMINSKINLPGTVHFDSLESYGDYGLFYTWDKSDHKAWDAAVARRKRNKKDAFDYWE